MACFINLYSRLLFQLNNTFSTRELGNQAASGLNCAAILHTIQKMNTWAKTISVTLPYDDEGSNWHLHYFISSIKLIFMQAVFTRHGSLRGVEGVIIFRVCEQHL